MRFLANTKGASVLPSLHREMDRLFGDVWGASAASTWIPAVDVRESKEAVEVKVELPGIAPENVELEVTGDLLEIRGEKSVEREAESENGEVRWHRFERRSGKFARALRLPSDVDAGKIEASAEIFLAVGSSSRRPTRTQPSSTSVQDTGCLAAFLELPGGWSL